MVVVRHRTKREDWPDGNGTTVLDDMAMTAACFVTVRSSQGTPGPPCKGKSEPVGCDPNLAPQVSSADHVCSSLRRCCDELNWSGTTRPLDVALTRPRD